MSALPVWFFPSHNGDFRLTKRGDGCTLVVERATLGEAETLAQFAKKARKWFREPLDIESPDYWSKRDREEPLDVDISKAGKLLLKLSRPKRATLTAIVSANGKVTVSEGTDEAAIDTIMKEDKVDPPKAAASVSRPTPCCPLCIPGAVPRASEVLLSFLTPAQHEQWARDRAIVVTGNLSGHRYVLAHRNSPRAVRQTKICRDLDADTIVHFHDWSVPPEEEVLASKLILEHREHWLRNEATGTFGVADPHNFKNPFGDFSDGLADAAFTRRFGEAFEQLGVAKRSLS